MNKCNNLKLLKRQDIDHHLRLLQMHEQKKKNIHTVNMFTAVYCKMEKEDHIISFLNVSENLF